MRKIACAVLLLALSACRSDPPPKISIICLGDGFGGADCVRADGSRQYLAPSELKNYWMTTEVDEQNFATWCYKTNPQSTHAAMTTIRREALSAR